MSDSSIMLDVQKLNKQFGSVHAVKDLTFQVKKGEVFGFLGPNGAGKTTTMRMITCFMPSTSGAIRIDGIDTTVDPMAIKEKIGYLPESAPLYNDMLVYEYINYVGELRGLSGDKLKNAAKSVIDICGLQKMLRREIGKLSKGYRQRVGLAQALIHDPELLILDEPMSGLDPNQIIEIRGLIKEIGKSKTVIYCSHILSEVSATCDRILIINEGSTVATGTPDELTAKADHNNEYKLRFTSNPESTQKFFSEVPGVAETKIETGEDGKHTLLVFADSNDDIGEKLFKCAVENKVVLSELRHEATSLEDVFTQLTRGKNNE